MAEDMSREAKAFLTYLEQRYPGEHSVCRGVVLTACGESVARILRVLFSEIFGFVIQAIPTHKPSATEILRAALDDLRSSRETLASLERKLSRLREGAERHLCTLLGPSMQQLDTLIETLSQGDPQRASEGELETRQASGRSPEPKEAGEWNDAISMEEKYGSAMDLTNQAEADAYFERCVEHRMRLGVTREEAECIERWLLGFCAGYYSQEVRLRVERLFRCVHPVFGPAR